MMDTLLFTAIYSDVCRLGLTNTLYLAMKAHLHHKI